jgi:hypothetical protein
MFNSILERGMCNGARGQCHLYQKRREYVSNRSRHDSDVIDQDCWYDSGVTSERYLIAPIHIQNAISRQYWVEQRMEKRQSVEQHALDRDATNLLCDDDYKDLRQSMSFAESALSSGSTSRATSTASVSSFDSAVSSIFSALTIVTGNANRYGIPFVTPASRSKCNSTNKRNLKKTKALVLSSIVDRYAILAQDSETEISHDWDYNLDLTKDDKDHQVPPNSAQVLHLKTCAYMSKFYVNEFLLYFPQYPLPPELATKNIQHILKQGGTASISRNAIDYKNVSPSPDSSMIPNAISSSIRLAVDDSSFVELALYGSLGLGTSRTELSQRSSLLANNGRGGNLKDFLVLGNSRSGKPIWVSSLKSKKGKPIVRIYATKPSAKSQESIICSDQLGLTKESHPLFTWAELRTEGGNIPCAETKYILHTCTGLKNEFHKEPLLTEVHGCEGVMDMNVIGRREDDEMNAVGLAFHCARFCIRSDPQTFESKPETNYIISIVKGVDVAMVLAMVAIIDELVEFSMRRKCAILAWKFPTENEK